MIPVPPHVRYEVTNWGRSVDPETSSETDLNAHVALCCEVYRKDNRNSTPEQLHTEIKEDFQGWTADTYKRVNIRAWREFRETCVLAGIPVRQAIGISYATCIQQLVEADELDSWLPKHQSERAIFLERYKEILGEKGPRGPFSTSTTNPDLIGRNPGLANAPTNPAPESFGTRNPYGGKSAQVVGFTQGQPDQPRDYQMYIRSDFHTPMIEFPAPPQSVVPDYSKQIGNISKVDSDEKKKYGGAEYEVLNDKLNVFYENCSRLGIQQNDHIGYAIAFSLMLKDDAHDFYISKLYGQNYEFWTMIALMKKHFEVPESTQKYLEEWRSMNSVRNSICSIIGIPHFSDMGPCSKIRSDMGPFLKIRSDISLEILIFQYIGSILVY